MTTKSKTIDLGGLTVICNDLKTGATKPGLSGSSVDELVGSGVLAVTPGTAEASKALILDAQGDITAGLNALTLVAALTAADVVTTDDVTVGDDLVVTGLATVGETLAVTGATTLSAAVIGGVQVLTGAGAVSVATLITRLNTTGADALTLANGTNGQVKIIVMGTDGGAGTLTPTTATGFTTLTFDDVGDSAMLVYLTTVGWMQVGTSTATAA